MAELSFTHREGPGKGREYPVKATQYFHRRGGKFVAFTAAGTASLVASGMNAVFGWLESPKDTAGYNSWVSTSGDKAFVIYGMEDVYEIPVLEDEASIAASYIGMAAALVTSGSTYAMKQYAKIHDTPASCTASPITIIDVDTTNKTAFVKIKPGHKQARG